MNCPTIGSSSTADGNHVLAANAVRAGPANDVIGRGLFLKRERFSASEADHNLRFLELGVHSNTLVKHKTIAVPVRTSNLLKITEDASFELLDVGEAGFDHDGTGFLAANAAGTKHNDGLVFHGVRKRLNRFGEGTEGSDVKIDGIVKRAHAQFVVVPRIQHMDVLSVVEHLLERLWLDLFAGEGRWLNVVHAHRDDLVLFADVHSVERLVIGVGYFERYASEPFILLEKLGVDIDGCLWSSEKEIDAFGRQQDRPLQARIRANAS